MEERLILIRKLALINTIRANNQAVGWSDIMYSFGKLQELISQIEKGEVEVTQVQLEAFMNLFPIVTDEDIVGFIKLSS